MKINKAKLAEEVLLENPKITANRTLAKILQNKYPVIFKDIEDARGRIRFVQGKMGNTAKQIRRFATPIFLEKLNAERAKYDLDFRTQEDKTPYVFGSNHNKALVIGDLHYPYTDIESLTIALEYAYNEGVDCIIINGDSLDFSTISRFISKPNEMRVMEQIEGVKNLLAWMQKVMDVKIVFHAGNHCYSQSTKVLTKDRGFVLFTELTLEDEVAQFDINTNIISYAKPISYVAKMYEGEIYTIENTYSKQSVTDLHDVIIGKEKKKAKDVEFEDIKNIPTNGNIGNTEYPIEDNYLKLLVNIICDATMVDERKYKPKSIKRRIQFKISKERKIEHLENLLTDLNIPYSKKLCKKTGINILQPYYIRIYGQSARDIFEDLNDSKKFPLFFKKLSRRQVQLVLEELAITDGYEVDGGVSITTTSKEDADMLLECFITNGFNCKYTERDAKFSGFINSKKQYHLRIPYNLGTNGYKSISSKHYSGMVYCVEMPLGTVITMLDGKVAFSGNCKRIEDYVLRQAPELYSANKLEKLLMLEDMKIDYVQDYRYMKFGNLNIAHGHHIVKGIFAPVNPARGVFSKTNTSTLISHVHKTSYHPEPVMSGGVIECFSIGAMTTVNPDYNPQVSKHNQGFAIVTKDPKTGDFEVHNKKISNHKIR